MVFWAPGVLLSPAYRPCLCLYLEVFLLFPLSHFQRFRSHMKVLFPIGVDFCTGWDTGIQFPSPRGHLVFPAPFVERLSLLFVKENQLVVAPWVCVWNFYSDPLTEVPVLVLGLCFPCYGSVVHLKISDNLQNCSFCSRLFWLSRIFFIWI